jgi:hypothetical protein
MTSSILIANQDFELFHADEKRGVRNDHECYFYPAFNLKDALEVI